MKFFSETKTLMKRVIFELCNSRTLFIDVFFIELIVVKCLVVNASTDTLGFEKFRRMDFISSFMLACSVGGARNLTLCSYAMLPCNFSTIDTDLLSEALRARHAPMVLASPG